MKKTMIKNALGSLCFLIILGLLIQGATYVTRDKNDAFTSYMYYKEEPGSLDVVFVGSSHLMCGVYPMELYRDFGIASYSFTSSALVTAQSYYHVVEALRYQSPRVLVLDVSGVKYDSKVGSKEFVHIQLDNMPLSLNKVTAIEDLIESPEERLEYYFPLIRFHTRWKSLGLRDFSPIDDPSKGGYVKDGRIEDLGKVEILPEDDMLELPDVAGEYLRKSIEYCRERGVELLLINTPVTDTQSQRYYNKVEEIAKEYGVPYLNMMRSIEELGFDFSEDMRDHAHCNIKGAMKVTEFVGEYLKENYELPDRREDERYREDWDKALEEFRARYKIT